MITLHRYMLDQLWKPILAVFFSLNLLVLVVQLLNVGEILFGSSLAFSDLLQVSLWSLPQFFIFTFPISVLTGVLLGIGRMANDGEIVALTATGVSTLQLALVPFGIGLVITLLGLGNNLWLAPVAVERLQERFIQLTKQNLATAITEKTFFDEIPGTMIYPLGKDRTGKGWEGLFLYDWRPQRTPYLILAQHASMHATSTGRLLTLRLKQGEIHNRSKDKLGYSITEFGSATIGIDVHRLINERTRGIHVAENLSVPHLLTLIDALETKPEQKLKYRLVLHKVFAFPLASVLLSLLATALGSRSKWRSRRGMLFLATLVVAGYYLVMGLADTVVHQEILAPELASWSPNLLLGIYVLYLLQSRQGGRT